VAARGEIGREGCEISSLVAGPSPRFSSRGAKNQTEEQKIRRGGGTFLKSSIGCMQQPGGPNVKWGGSNFKWGAGHHCPPAGDNPVWSNIWNCALAVFIFSGVSSHSSSP